MTRHAYLPTTLITDKGTAFTSRLVDEVAKILGIQIKCATTKHPQMIGKSERNHASLKCNLKMASGEYRRQWHKYLPLAVLNYNTTYHSSIGCEPSRIFHGRIPYNILDHRLGLNPNPKILPTTDFAEELQRRTQILIDRTKKNIMQSYLKYKEYYDRKAKAAPLHQGDYCFILQPLADHQGSKIPFREFRWTGPYIIEKVLPNENYIVRKLNSNKTQILHRIRLRKYTPNTDIRDVRPEGNLQTDDEITIPQDDLYIISWETEFDDFPPNSEFKNASDDPSMNSDQRDAKITDLDLRSTRHDQNTDDTQLLSSAETNSPNWTLGPLDCNTILTQRSLSNYLGSRLKLRPRPTLSQPDSNQILIQNLIQPPPRAPQKQETLIFQILERRI